MATVWEIVTATGPLTLRLVMGLALVGAFCRKGESRAWWLGFAVLGWLYLEAAFTPFEFAVPLPTEMLLGAIASSTFPSLTRIAPRQPGLLDAIFSLWNCLWALLAAYFGGFLAREIFRTITRREEQPPSSPGSADPQRARPGIRTSLIYLTGLALGLVIVVGSALLPPVLWAGLTFVLTCGVLGLLALQASSGEHNRRIRSLFASVLGISMLILFFGRSDLDPWPISPTVELLDDIRPWVPTYMSSYPAGSEVRSAANARVHEALKRKVQMQFVEETPLEDVLNHIQKQTRGSDGKAIGIEVGPLHEGGEVNLTMSPSLRMIDLDGVPLRTSLKLGLEQLDLTYDVQNGVLVIHSTESGDQILSSVGRNAYQSVGHCLLAMIAAGLGCVLAPLVCSVGRRRQPAIATA